MEIFCLVKVFVIHSSAHLRLCVCSVLLFFLFFALTAYHFSCAFVVYTVRERARERERMSERHSTEIHRMAWLSMSMATECHSGSQQVSLAARVPATKWKPHQVAQCNCSAEWNLPAKSTRLITNGNFVNLVVWHERKTTLSQPTKQHNNEYAGDDTLENNYLRLRWLRCLHSGCMHKRRANNDGGMSINDCFLRGHKPHVDKWRFKGFPCANIAQMWTTSQTFWHHSVEMCSSEEPKKGSRFTSA